MLLTNARILTMDTSFTEHERGWLRVEGDRIAALGPGDPADATGAIDLSGDLLMPGFVNPHCHMPMTLFRGLGEDVDDRLFRYVLPAGARGDHAAHRARRRSARRAGADPRGRHHGR